MKNHEKLRKMNIDELAELLEATCENCCIYYDEENYECTNDDIDRCANMPVYCKDGIKLWLEKEAE